MRVLFICRANVGRSQAAKGFYNLIHPASADSAGTLVDRPGERLDQRTGAVNIIKVMLEQGIDISQSVRVQLDRQMVERFDQLIVMAEPDTIPKWLSDNPKTTVWTVPDPKGQDLDRTRRIAGQIKDLVGRL